LGFPTANLRTTNELLPAHGIYASMVALGDTWRRAVTSIGVRPTIGDGQFTVETYILDGTHDLYGKRLRVAFVKYLRPEAAFDGLAALKGQIALDCAEAEALFAQMAV
jgi:riboflavin kinase/FMN adenylyltransferase